MEEFRLKGRSLKASVLEGNWTHCLYFENPNFISFLVEPVHTFDKSQNLDKSHAVKRNIREKDSVFASPKQVLKK